MNATLAILRETFGLVGLLGAAAWLTSIVALAAGGLLASRWRLWCAATALAATAAGLALVTSASIRGIEIDRSTDVRAAEAVAATAAREKFQGRAADIRFAEDTAADRADIAGVTVAEEEGAYERAMAEELAKMPTYRLRGRQQRSGVAAEATPVAANEVSRPVRMLPQSELVVADRFDRVNRAAAWGTLAMAVGLLGWEYVRRFNSPFESIWPLPLAGTAIDGLSTKPHVCDLSGEAIVSLPSWLETIVRKGESFLVFVETDPLPSRDSLPCFTVGPLRWLRALHRFSAERLRADPSLLGLAFESAWFGRGCSIVIGESAAGDLLDQVALTLAQRRACRAATRYTLTIVWSLSIDPPPKADAQIARLAAATNIRWVR